jgi:hypothetical protein
LLVAAAIAHGLPNTFELEHDWRTLPALALAFSFVSALFVLYVGRQVPFLYFQF